MTAQMAQLLADMRAKSAARNALTAKLEAMPGGLRMLTEDGRKLVISPDLDRSGEWRTTYCDERGPSGHVTYNTKADAIRDALLYGFKAQEVTA
jgi:hypothetical protein